MYFGNSICASNWPPLEPGTHRCADRLTPGSPFALLVCAGLVAEAAADLAPLTAVSATSAWHYGGNTAPFDLSAASLLLCLVLVSVSWTENYGEARARAGGGGDGDGEEGRRRGGDEERPAVTSLERRPSPRFGRVLVATLSDPTLVLCGVAVATLTLTPALFPDPNPNPNPSDPNPNPNPNPNPYPNPTAATAVLFKENPFLLLLPWRWVSRVPVRTVRL